MNSRDAIRASRTLVLGVLPMIYVGGLAIALLIGPIEERGHLVWPWTYVLGVAAGIAAHALGIVYASVLIPLESGAFLHNLRRPALIVWAVSISVVLVLLAVYEGTRVRLAGRLSSPVYVGLVITWLGASLFYFRWKFRSLYGVSEVVLGVAIGTNNFALDAHLIENYNDAGVDVKLSLGILTAGLYLIVRGLDNVHQGIVREPKDLWASALWQRLQNISRHRVA